MPKTTPTSQAEDVTLKAYKRWLVNVQLKEHSTIVAAILTLAESVEALHSTLGDIGYNH